MTQAASGPNDDMEIGARIIPEEPMAIVSLVLVHLPPLPLFHIPPPSSFIQPWGGRASS
jgi:hypothetical protein